MPCMPSCRPDTYLFNAAAAACEVARQWPKALTIVDEMQGQGCRPNWVTLGLAVRSCARGALWQLAMAYLRPEASAVPDASAYASGVEACSLGGHTLEAGLLMVALAQKGGDSLRLLARAS
ncbi:unnamed protein product [Effrenium voratum]|nr:unnamed protein product [Effrenium voratum]